MDARQREIRQASVVPDLDRGLAKQPDFAVVYDQGYKIVWRAFSAGEIQRIDGRAVKQGRHPELLAVGFVEDKIAVKEAYGRGAGEVRVRDLRENVGVGVVDVPGGAGRDEQLRPVIHHRHGAGARDGAFSRCDPLVIYLVQRVAGDGVAVITKRPQPAHRPDAKGDKRPQAWRALEERRLLAALWHQFWEQVDHAVVGGVDAARHIRRS